VAFVDGRWLNREEREERINKLENIVKLLEEKEKLAPLPIHEQRYLLDTLRELVKLKRVHRAEYDLLYFMLEYFSEDGNPGNPGNLIPTGINYDNSALFHKELCRLLDEITIGKVKSNVAWCVGRGHAKTAYLSNGYLCHQLVYRHKKYIVLVSETTGVAGDFIGWTRNQLKHNRKLREDFGELLSAQKTKNIADNNEEFITYENQKVEARGIGTQVRGLRNNETRPDLFLLDDLESKDNTNTPEAIAKNKAWFCEELLEALDVSGMCIYMGTIVAYDSLLDWVIKKRKDFKSRKFPAILSWSERPDLWDEWRKIYNSDDPEALEKSDAFFNANKEEMLRGTKVLWEARFSYLDLMKKRENNGVKAFNQEYLGEPTDEERQIFKPEYFHYFTEEDIAGRDFDYYGAIDFAMGKEKGDYSVIATLAKSKVSNVCYVVDVFMERVHPDVLLQTAVQKALQYQYKALAVEAQHAQEWFADKLAEALQEHGYPAYTRLKQVKQRTRKELRIESLLPDIQAGKIRFSRDMKDVLEQFTMYPMHKHDDAPDAVQMAYSCAINSHVSVRTSKKRLR
jgi:predicted phage terminase large subunit-like protein